jgi:hypothetical protein
MEKPLLNASGQAAKQIIIVGIKQNFRVELPYYNKTADSVKGSYRKRNKTAKMT